MFVALLVFFSKILTKRSYIRNSWRQSSQRQLIKSKSRKRKSVCLRVFGLAQNQPLTVFIRWCVALPIDRFSVSQFTQNNWVFGVLRVLR